MLTLTERQKQIVQFIRRSIEANQRPPTYREIMVEFGFSSTNGVVGHLKALVRKNVIEWDAGESRGIRLKGVRVQLIPEG